MYVIIDEATKELLDEVNCDTFKIRDEDVVYTDDLISTIYNLNQKYEDLQEDLESNYKPIPMMEQIGMSERDFY